MPSLVRDIWTSFWVSVVATFAINGTVATLWTAYIPGGTQIDNRLVLTLVIVCVVICGLFAEITRRSYAERSRAIDEGIARTRRKPAVRSSIVENGRRYLIATPVELFGNDTVVAIYQSTGGAQFFIGVGRALHNPGTDFVQIEIIEDQFRAQVWDQVFQNNAAVLQSLSLRTAISYDIYQRQVAP